MVTDLIAGEFEERSMIEKSSRDDKKLMELTKVS